MMRRRSTLPSGAAPVMFESPEETAKRTEDEHRRHWQEVRTNPSAHGLTTEQAEKLGDFFDPKDSPQVAGAEAEAHEYALARVLHDELDEARGELERYGSLQPVTIAEADDKPAGVARRKADLANIEAKLQALNPVPLRPGLPPPDVVAGTPKTWTPERLEELSAYRKTHGTKKAAAFFRVSESRVRALLPSEKPQLKGYNAFNPNLK